MAERLAALRNWLPHPAAWPVVGLAIAGAMYACVPETDQFVTVAAMLVGCGLIEVLTRRRLPVAVLVAAVAVLVWAGHHGAAGQARAHVGAAFAFWPAVLVVVIAVVWPTTAQRPLAVRWLVVAFGAAAALLVARTGALDPGYGPALRSIALWAPLSLAVSAAVLAVPRGQPSRGV